jgi:hypothetical protein
MEQELNKTFIGKRYRFDILKDGKRLTFNGVLLELNENLVVFKDKYDCICSFNSKLIQSAIELKGDSDE